MTALGRPKGGSWTIWPVAITDAKRNENKVICSLVIGCCCLCIALPLKRRPDPLNQYTRESPYRKSSAHPEGGRSLANFYDVIEKRVRDLKELVRGSVGHDDYIALGDLSGFTGLDAGAADLVRGYGLGVNRLAAGDERCFALDDIDHVGVLGVNFCLSGFFAAAGMDHV